MTSRFPSSLTQWKTTLLKQHPGDLVNLECDIIGKYVEKLIGLSSPANAEHIDDFRRFPAGKRIFLNKERMISLCFNTIP